MIALITSTLVGGLPLWTSGIRSVQLDDLTFIGLWVGLGVLLSFTLLLFISLRAGEMASSFATGFVIAVILHFVGSILIHSVVQPDLISSVLISLVVGGATGASGPLIWSGIKRGGRR